MSRVEPESKHDQPPGYQQPGPPPPGYPQPGPPPPGYQQPGPPQPRYQQQPMGHPMQPQMMQPQMMQPQMMQPQMIQPQMMPQPMHSMGQQQMTTVVINNQPGQQRNPLLVGTRNGTRDWTSGLCGCCEDIGSCCMTFWCSWASTCSIAVRVGDSFCMPLCVPDALLALRVRVRGLGDIKGSICEDCMVINFCAPCAACQMLRELNAMGL
ncbi:placenta-specific gene 8 protein-like [Dreissena polymorpha]|uniref:Uncharacterized protein n=1 Tax=Dreissena polymorpha TaxID=45954 RepID=A0A9D4CQS1_DREPO|nr:placenta-specific gene 8 protein-like [Dreissena polymorpha]KAH3728693.1 hypothetical protein DPMN_054653 [Dreissena polymorpha]